MDSLLGIQQTYYHNEVLLDWLVGENPSTSVSITCLISSVVIAVSLYSASVVERDAVGCLLLH